MSCELREGQAEIKHLVEAENCRNREEALKRELDNVNRALLQLNITTAA